MSNFNGREDLRIGAHHIRQLKSRITGYGSKIAETRRRETGAISKRTEIETVQPEWVQPNARIATSYAMILIAIGIKNIWQHYSFKRSQEEK